jgi:hypothetical protein
MDYLKELNLKIGQWVRLKDGMIAQIIESKDGNSFAWDRDVEINLDSAIISLFGIERALLHALGQNIVKVGNSEEEVKGDE